ncbi:MAG TPA: phosphate regulon sensor histidine kinase PhoR [Acidobacteriota bacterium]|jgi:two-component system phosphate regulon sensor histidine kinase PhoR
MKLQLQIFVAALSISAMIVVALDVFLPGRLQPYLVDQFTAELRQEALLIRNVLEHSVGSDSEMRQTANRFGGVLGRRITLISPAGNVLGDNSADAARMENHNDRPEVTEARRRGFGRSIRYSHTLGREMLYVAVPFRTFRGETGVVRLSLDHDVILRARSEVRRVIYWLSFLAFLVSAGLAYLLAYGISRSAAAMARAAQTVTQGDFTARAPIGGPQELRALGRAFNQMTDRLVTQLHENTAERQKLWTILEGMGEGVLMMDSGGSIEFMNPACRRMLQLSRPVQGQKIMELVRRLELDQAIRRVFGTGESQRLEMELDNPRKNIVVNIYPVMKNETLRGAVLVFQDFTALRNLENVRKDFVANVSHELRTPLTSLRGYAETLLENKDLDPGTRNSFHATIYKNATRLSALIDDLLTLSSLESGSQNLQREPLDLKETAQSVMASVQSLLQSKKQSCVFSSDSNALVEANRSGLEQVLYNLLDNAIKYTPEGGAIRVSIRHNGKGVQLVVEDTGIGIPAAELPRIFERFYRVDKSRSREMGGTGLGLAIVKHLVHLHGGTIEVSSAVNKGSTFTLQLPAAANSGL